MNLYVSFTSIITALIFVVIGLAVFAVACKGIVSALTSAFRKELIEEKNMAFAVFAGLVALSVAIIVAAAVH